MELVCEMLRQTVKLDLRFDFGCTIRREYFYLVLVKRVYHVFHLSLYQTRV